MQRRNAGEGPASIAVGAFAASNAAIGERHCKLLESRMLGQVLA